MFDIEKAVRVWMKALRKFDALEDGVAADIELQLRDTVDALKCEGLCEEEAFRRAAAQLGAPDKIAAEYRKNQALALDRRRPWLFWNSCSGRSTPSRPSSFPPF